MAIIYFFEDVNLPKLSKDVDKAKPFNKNSLFGKYFARVCQGLNVPFPSTRNRGDGTNHFYNPAFLLYLVEDVSRSNVKSYESFCNDFV
jgi:hypothetical protein